MQLNTYKSYKGCIECNESKPLTREFFKRFSFGGKEIFHNVCRNCSDKLYISRNWKEGKLICSICKEYKDEIEFDINKNKSILRHYRDSRCKKCKTKQGSRCRNSRTGEAAINRIITERWLGARNRAKKYNIEFDITKEYLLDLLKFQDYKCNISKIDLTFELGKGRVYTNLSIDKKVSSLGYIKGNVQLVCMAVNQMKSDLDINTLLHICNCIIKNCDYEN